MNTSPPFITADQRRQLEDLSSLAQSLNSKINLYSAASAQSFWRLHIEHSLTLASKSFPQQAQVVDWGTGGGMPGLPLAILFPETQFVLVDAVRKKVQAVESMARRLGLRNVEAWHGRAEAWEGKATHSVSRATAPLITLWGWHERVAIEQTTKPPLAWRPGLICLKGGDLHQEIADLVAVHEGVEVIRTPLANTGAGHDFEEKVIVEVYRDLGKSNPST
jgi:16S rRNA (guanine527-N7)-methyltransferase